MREIYINTQRQTIRVTEKQRLRERETIEKKAETKKKRHSEKKIDTPRATATSKVWTRERLRDSMSVYPLVSIFNRNYYKKTYCSLS